MAILNFSDVLKNVGLDPKDVKLIWHAFTQKAGLGAISHRALLYFQFLISHC